MRASSASAASCCRRCRQDHVFDPLFTGLTLAEAEFDDEASQGALEVPSGWMEVTGDAGYSGAALARRAGSHSSSPFFSLLFAIMSWLPLVAR
jgi:hypothetical protein